MALDMYHDEPLLAVNNERFCMFPIKCERGPGSQALCPQPQRLTWARAPPCVRRPGHLGDVQEGGGQLLDRCVATSRQAQRASGCEPGVQTAAERATAAVTALRALPGVATPHVQS